MFSTLTGATRAAVYARVSTEEQRERQTIQTQLGQVYSWAKRSGVEITKTYSDDGISGTLPLAQREAGLALLADARSGLFDLVLVYRVDRLGRDTRVILESVHDIEKAGVQVKSVSEPFDTSDPVGKLTLTLLSGIASFERDSILERSRAGTQRLAREGAWLGGIVPYGYRVEGAQREARLVVSRDPLPGYEEGEAAVIAEIFERVGNDGWSCQRVADKLNAQSVPTVYARDGRGVGRGKRKAATAGRWYTSRVRGILTNTTYKSVHQYGKRSKTQNVIEREVPAIVSVELWEAAQATLKRNFIHATRNTRYPYLLRSLIRCAHCGHTYIGTHNKGRAYYLCTSKQTHTKHRVLPGGPCPSRYLRAAELEEQIWADIEGFLRNPGDALALLEERADEQKDQQAQLARQLAALETTKSAKATERERMLNLYRRGLIDDRELEVQLGEVRREEEQVEAEQRDLQNALASYDHYRQSAKSTEEMLRGLRTAVDGDLPWEKKREIVLALVERVSIDWSEPGGRADVTYLFSPVTNDTDRDSGRR